jgi:hypothetical protein
VLLSESKRFLFVHVQKTAGTSIAELLAPYALAPPASRWNKLVSDLGLRRDWRRFHFRRHAPLVRAERVLPAELYGSLFKFAFVRNPWDRLVSWHAFILEDRQHRRHHKVRRQPDFTSFVHGEAGRRRRSQWWMLRDSAGRLGVDFVGRFENLERDVAAVCSRLGIEYRQLPRVKTSRHAPYQTFYTPALADFVARHWATEIEAFGYTFNG